MEKETEATPPAEPVVDKKPETPGEVVTAEGEKAEKKAEAVEHEPTVKEVYACLKGIEARLDYFAELVLDTEAIEEIEEPPAVVAVVAPAEPEKKPEPKPEQRKEVAGNNDERPRHHSLM